MGRVNQLLLASEHVHESIKTDINTDTDADRDTVHSHSHRPISNSFAHKHCPQPEVLPRTKIRSFSFCAFSTCRD